MNYWDVKDIYWLSHSNDCILFFDVTFFLNPRHDSLQYDSLSFCMSVCLSVCLCVCLSFYWSVCQTIIGWRIPPWFWKNSNDHIVNKVFYHNDYIKLSYPAINGLRFIIGCQWVYGLTISVINTGVHEGTEFELYFVFIFYLIKNRLFRESMRPFQFHFSTCKKLFSRSFKFMTLSHNKRILRIVIMS